MFSETPRSIVKYYQDLIAAILEGTSQDNQVEQEFLLKQILSQTPLPVVYELINWIGALTIEQKQATIAQLENNTEMPDSTATVLAMIVSELGLGAIENSKNALLPKLNQDAISSGYADYAEQTQISHSLSSLILQNTDKAKVFSQNIELDLFTIVNNPNNKFLLSFPFAIRFLLQTRSFTKADVTNFISQLQSKEN